MALIAVHLLAGTLPVQLLLDPVVRGELRGDTRPEILGRRAAHLAHAVAPEQHERVLQRLPRGDAAGLGVLPVTLHGLRLGTLLLPVPPVTLGHRGGLGSLLLSLEPLTRFALGLALVHEHLRRGPQLALPGGLVVMR